MFDHFFGDFEIGNHAIGHGPDCPDIARCFTKHHLGFFTNRQHLGLTTHLGHRNNGRFIQDDAPPFDIDQRVRCPQINADICRKHTQYSAEHAVSPEWFACYYPADSKLFVPIKQRAEALCCSLFHVDHKCGEI